MRDIHLSKKGEKYMSKRVKVRPSKGQSLAGGLVGIVFVIIGVTVVIPSAGAFGALWTLFALIITVMNLINGFSEEGISTHEIVIDDDKYSSYDKRRDNIVGCREDVKDSDDVEDKLIKLNSLLDKGLITQEEYEKKRKDIIETL